MQSALARVLEPRFRLPTGVSCADAVRAWLAAPTSTARTVGDLLEQRDRGAASVTVRGNRGAVKFQPAGQRAFPSDLARSPDGPWRLAEPTGSGVP
jgi:hypothetical protein